LVPHWPFHGKTSFKETDQRATHQPDIFEKHVLHLKTFFLTIVLFRSFKFLSNCYVNYWYFYNFLAGVAR
jgi:hypothetical protein